jgi:subtilase family serine protease
MPSLSGYPETVKKIIARTLVISLVFLLGINAFGPYQPKVSADAGADLTVQDISLSPQEPVIDDTVTVTVTIKNQGSAAAGASQVECYVDSVILATKPVSTLNAGAAATVAFTWQARAGSHTFKAIADSAGVITETDETNNIKTFTMSTLAADLTIQSLTWAPQNPSKGDNIVVTVNVRNMGSLKSRATNVTLYVDGVSTGSQDIDAINPGSTVTRTFNWVALSGQHTIKAVVDVANYTKESDETNNEQSSSFSTLPPDLIIQAVTWTPENPARNDLVTFKVTVKNQGSGRADSCQLGYYIDNIYIAAVPVSTLEAGVSSNVTFTWTALPDTHNLKTVVDYYDKVVESDETNNENIVFISTTAPDLIIKDISWTPQDAGVGDNMTFSVIIKNQGLTKALASRASYYFGGTYRGYLNIPLLNAGEEVTRTFQYTPEYEMVIVNVTVDYDNAITETHEENNTVTRTITIIKADLTINSITYLPLNPVVGDAVTFTVCLKNLGSGKAESFQIGYYIDDVLLKSDPIYLLAGDASTNKTYTWQVQNGQHIFKAIADYSHLVTESSETNNEYSLTVIPYMPDLTIGTVTWSPPDAPVGSEVAFDVKIENTGNLHTSTSRVAYYVDGENVGYADIGALDPGDTVTKHFTWVATAGPHTINIVADVNNQVLELDEANNTKVVSLPPPDLVVQDIAFSTPDASIGDTVVITVSIKNQGSSITQTSLVTCYVDGIKIATQDLPQIQPGGTSNSSFNWVAEAGSHTFKITTDINNQVIEADETNNDKETTYSTLTPDLVVQGITWRTNSQLESNEATFTITIKNSGTGIAGESQVQYSFDEDPPATKDLAPIAAGETAEFSFISIISPGAHTANITADCNNSVIELDENNNESIIPFSTIAPDLIIRTITWAPLDAKIGDDITITAKVENRGTVKAVNLRLALSVDGAIAAYAEIPEIDIDFTASADFLWKAIEGQHEITVLADADQTIAESDESNNTKSRTISFEKPEAPAKKIPNVSATPSADNGFLNRWWWLLLLVAAVLGIAAFVTTLRTLKKK